jgi:hypothetical protein
MILFAGCSNWSAFVMILICWGMGLEGFDHYLSIGVLAVIPSCYSSQISSFQVKTYKSIVVFHFCP